MNEVIAQLFEARKKQRVSISTLASHLEVTPGCISHWERHRRHPKIDALARWADYLSYELQIHLTSKE